MLAFNVFPCDFSVRRKKSFGDRRGSFCVRAGLERALKSRQANVASSTQAQTSPISPWKNRRPEKEDRRNGSGTIASSKVGPEPRRRAQSSAQSVETAEGGQEYPAEEAPRKMANTEPTEGQTDAAAETEAQDPAAEPTEPEGEALSLDSIDDLVLPVAVDPGEEQQSQRWRITDDGCADWALKKIKLEKDEHDRIVALAQQEIARLTDQIAKADRRYEQNTSFLTSMLAEFFETVPHKKTKTGTESYRLLNGQLVKKPAGIKLQPDDEKLVAWLRAAGREDLIKVETKAMWGELKKQLEMVGTVAMMPDTGEIIEGIDVVEVPAAFSVKF